ncbi:MAG: S24/S26 family peptidase, partial [Candidatus Polarisedimenticolia bacterium]
MTSPAPPPAADRAAETILEALFADGHETLVPVRGESMLPALRTGDVAVVAPFVGPPRPGQIVLARAGGLLVLHRLLRIDLRPEGRRYRIAGDAATGFDAPLARQALLG